MILDKSASSHFFLLHSGKTTTLVLIYVQSDAIKTNDIVVSKLCHNAVTKVSQTRLFKMAEIYCLAFLEAGRNPGVSRARSLKAIGEDLFSAFPLGFWCSQPAWHALAGGYCSPVSASIITWPLSSLCVHVAVFLSGHQSYGIGTHPTPG